MAGTSATLPIQETDVIVLKETLRSQQQLLQKLYSELDVERESSATAANESLSMILRLQSEKASMKMEAIQYKRLAEEKIGHAEESLAILEELIYQKEMEISSLEFQVQAYRYKLLTLGCDDLNDLEKQFTSNRLAERNDAFNREKGIKSTIRRLSSLPASLPIDFSTKKSSNDGENNPAPVQDSCSSTDAGNSDTVVRAQGLVSSRSSVNSAAGEFNSYLEQIRLLDEKVKQIADCKEVGLKKTSNDKVESVSLNSSSLIECYKIKSHEDSTEFPISSSAISSGIVHDIFEVPVMHKVLETSAKGRTCFDGEKCNGKSVLECDDRLIKPEDKLGLPVKDDVDWLKMNNFLSAKPEGKMTCLLKYATECIKANRSITTDADSKSALRDLAACITDYQSELKQLRQSVEKLESGTNNARHEIVERREEELNLLKDLREQLNSIQSELRSWKPKEPPSPTDEVSLVPLTEAMMYSWL
ncbi:hypothetical protein HRI_002532800 [Hibiscus trionum]|uniref:GTD-binding domain-containing protein n=1 Tax=Hibiscus trionum TaxID=183268 RepID=A0A9W7I228_HIBTR|nr:hypothetical protein HRI_002532800 [Hibiscus trionum]